MKDLPIAVIGAGGHARVVLQALRSAQASVVTLTDLHPQNFPAGLDGCPVITDEELLSRYSHNEILIACGVAAISPAVPDHVRRKVVQRFTALGYRITQVIHSHACVANIVRIDQGVQIHAGAVIQPGVTLGAHAIVNTGTTVDHDCQIGEFTHLAPGVTLSGNVTVMEGAHIGTGAKVIQGVTIGRFAMVAAGACVVSDVADDTVVMGVPARVVSR